MDFLDVLGYVLTPCLVILIANVSNAGAKLLQLCLTQLKSFVTPWTIAHEASVSFGILQARILEWVVSPSSKGSS